MTNLDKKLTIVAGTTNRLLDVLIERIEKEGWYVSRIQQANITQGGRFISWLRLVKNAYHDLVKILKNKNSIIAYHFFGAQSLFSSIALPFLGKKYVIHFWGSDYFYWKSRNNILLRYSLRHAHNVTFANSELLAEAKEIWGENIKFKLLRFGLEVIDFIDEVQPLKVSSSKLHKVVVGTNSQVGQQHIAIIDALENSKKINLTNFLFIFPLNYGDKNNKQKIINRLAESKLQYEILNEYIGGARLASFRLNSGILIQVQKTDAMSGAMMETLYAGGKIITGTWLSYGDLRSIGIEWFEVQNINEIPPMLAYVADKTINSEKNKEIISNISRWRNVLPYWLDCYSY